MGQRENICVIPGERFQRTMNGRVSAFHLIRSFDYLGGDRKVRVSEFKDKTHWSGCTVQQFIVPRMNLVEPSAFLIVTRDLVRTGTFEDGRSTGSCGGFREGSKFSRVTGN